MKVETCVTVGQTFVDRLGARRKQSLCFDLLKYYPLVVVCLQHLNVFPSAVLSFQMVCENLQYEEGGISRKLCYIEHLNAKASNLSVLRSKLPTGVQYVRFDYFETSAIDQSIFNCFENSVKTVEITNSQSLLKIVVPGNFTIQQLDVEKTPLKWIRFQPNDAITVVWIVYSSLQQVPPSLKNLKNLNNIKLQHSNIQHLSFELFKWCRKLDRLDLAYNNIRTITNTLSSGHRRDLHLLNLSNNELRILNLEVLPPVGWFKYVDLSYNKIELLVGQFSSDHLDSIILSHNRLKTLDFCQWKPMTSLTSIFFDWNELSRVPNCMHHLPRLVFISLNNNQLSTVNMDAFGVMENLLDLDLSANRISLIIFREDKYPKRLSRLVLSKNIINCNGQSDLPFCPLDVEFQPRASQSEWVRNGVSFIKQLMVVTQ